MKTKTCIKCGESYRTPHRKSYCPTCHAEYCKLWREEKKAQGVYKDIKAKDYKNSVERHGRLGLADSCNSWVRRKYGWSKDMAVQARAEQQGLCHICNVKMDVENKRSATGEHADHCHETNQARALLCSACNRSLGIYENNQRPAGLRLEPYEDYLNVDWAGKWGKRD